MRRSFYLALLTFIILLSCVSSYLDAKPSERIVSLSPNLTQIVYALGAWDRVVGVTIYSEYSEFPSEAKALPKVGGWVNPSYEAIIALRPDLVLLEQDQYSIFGEKLRNLGLRTFIARSTNSIKDILQSISNLGKILGKEKEAKKLNTNIKASLNEISKKTNNKKKKRALIIVGRNPGTLDDLYVIGSNNYIDELLTIAGGKNVVESERPAIKISKEVIFSFNPEVIFEISHRNSDLADKIEVGAKGVGVKNEILDIWSEFNQVDAVRNNRVYIISSDALLYPSQRIVEGAKNLYQALHPQLTR